MQSVNISIREANNEKQCRTRGFMENERDSNVLVYVQSRAE